MTLDLSKVPVELPARTQLPVVRLAAVTLTGAVLVAGAWFAPVRLAVVHGDSMAPRLRPGQLLLCERKIGSHPVSRGDVVLARVQDQICVKRVFAVGGDRFWQSAYGPPDGAQLQLFEPNISIKPWRKRYRTMRFTEVVVPRNSVYLLGEAPTSQDSRRWGPVSDQCVLGRVLLPAVASDDGWVHSVAWNRPPQRPSRS